MSITILDIIYVSFIIVLALFWIKAIQAKRKIDSGEIEVRDLCYRCETIITEPYRKEGSNSQ